MLNRDIIISMLLKAKQEPTISVSKHLQPLPNTGTVIETKSKGVFYILEYTGDNAVGWTINDNRLKQIQAHPKYAIILVDAYHGEIFAMLESNTTFYNNLINQNISGGGYKVTRKTVAGNCISQQNLDEYFNK